MANRSRPNAMLCTSPSSRWSETLSASIWCASWMSPWVPTISPSFASDSAKPRLSPSVRLTAPLELSPRALKIALFFGEDAEVVHHHVDAIAKLTIDSHCALVQSPRRDQ